MLTGPSSIGTDTHSLTRKPVFLPYLQPHRSPATDATSARKPTWSARREQHPSPGAATILSPDLAGARRPSDPPSPLQVGCSKATQFSYWTPPRGPDPVHTAAWPGRGWSSGALVWPVCAGPQQRCPVGGSREPSPISVITQVSLEMHRPSVWHWDRAPPSAWVCTLPTVHSLPNLRTSLSTQRESPAAWASLPYTGQAPFTAAAPRTLQGLGGGAQNLGGIGGCGPGPLNIGQPKALTLPPLGS